MRTRIRVRGALCGAALAACLAVPAREARAQSQPAPPTRTSAKLLPVADASQKSVVAAREQSSSTATRVETANATAELINLLLPIMAGTALSVLALHLLTHSGHNSGGGPRLMHH